MATRERNLLEAYLHGWSMICLAIAATLTAVGTIMAACGLAGIGGATWLLWKVYQWRLNKSARNPLGQRGPRYDTIRWADGSTFRYRVG